MKKLLLALLLLTVPLAAQVPMCSNGYYIGQYSADDQSYQCTADILETTTDSPQIMGDSWEFMHSILFRYADTPDNCISWQAPSVYYTRLCNDPAYTTPHNYVYMPHDDGTIALTSDVLTYTASGTLLQLIGNDFSLKEATITAGKGCMAVDDHGVTKLDCSTTYLTTEADPIAHQGDVTGGVAATVVGDDSHEHTDTTHDALMPEDNALIRGGWTFDPVDAGPPFFTTSTGLVVNLNAQYLNGLPAVGYFHTAGDYAKAITSPKMYIPSYCTWGGSGYGDCENATLNPVYDSEASGSLYQNSYSPDAASGADNGMLQNWRLWNAGTQDGSMDATWTLSYTEACWDTGCGGTERAERDVLELTANNSTGVVSAHLDALTADSVQGTKVMVGIGAAPPATCTAGEIYIDTDETNDTNCTTTADNSLCLCVAANTWVALENN